MTASIVKVTTLSACSARTSPKPDFLAVVAVAKVVCEVVLAEATWTATSRAACPPGNRREWQTWMHQVRSWKSLASSPRLS